jgi:plasmid stability protein
MEANVSLSIKNVPPVLAKALGARAKRHHRSIQGELMHILAEAVREPSAGFDPDRLIRMATALGVESSESSVDFIREFRDSR